MNSLKLTSLLSSLLFLWSTTGVRAQQVDFVTAYKDSTFSIQVPDYLVQVNDLNPNASLQFSNYFNETYLMVVNERIWDHPHQSLDSIQNCFERKMKEKNALLINTTSCIINGQPSKQFEVRMEVEGTAFQYLVTFILSNQQLYKIYSWTLASQRNQYMDDFKRTALSFEAKLKLGRSLK